MSAPERECIICHAPKPETGARETARVHSNVRRFRSEEFSVWRCPSCRSIHAEETVDLNFYYASYPAFKGLEPRMYPTLDGQLERLTNAGVTKDHRILDFGAGSGLLLDYLKLRGYSRAAGYDAHAERFADESVLSEKYDCLVCQDVLEHVDDPLESLRQFDRLVVPGGVVVIGTPDADAIDLAKAEDFVHTLHAPYHRHILSARALRSAAEAIGWSVTRFYPTMYANSLHPMQNPRFGLHYLKCHDDCLDTLTEPPKLSVRLMTPVSVFFAVFGYFFDRHTDVTFAFRTATEAR